MKYVLVSMALMLQPVFADDSLNGEDLLHASAHIGTTYLITHATEVVCKKIAGKEHKLACTLVGVGAAVAASVVKETVMDSGESNHRHLVGYGEDLIGIGAAVTLISIDF